MRAQMETLEVVGNNIANASTHGYKADRDFYRLFLSAQAQADPLTGQISRMPSSRAQPLISTRAPSSPPKRRSTWLCRDRVFLVVEGPGGELYTRSGSLRRSASGVLETAEGFSVLDSQRGSISIPPNGKIEVGAGGMISIEGLELPSCCSWSSKRSGSVEGRQQLFPRRRRNHPATGRRDEPESGKLEASNVNVAEEAVRLMLAMRHFQMMRRVASLVGDELNGRAIEVLGSTR